MAGSSAAALTGLMFVVITLVRGEERASAHDGIATFSTPTVMHFCAALFVSAILCAPWPSLVYVAVIVGLVGCYGILYLARVALRAKRLTKYTADLEDWMWYTVLPLLAYGALSRGRDRSARRPARRALRSRRRRAFADLHRHSQLLGRRNVSRHRRRQGILGEYGLQGENFSRRSKLAATPFSIPDSIAASRPSRESKNCVIVTVVEPSGSVKAVVTRTSHGYHG